MQTNCLNLIMNKEQILKKASPFMTPKEANKPIVMADGTEINPRHLKGTFKKSNRIAPQIGNRWKKVNRPYRLSCRVYGGGEMMAVYKTKRYLPILRLALDIPYIHIYTAVMSKSMEMAIFEYVALYWEIWKWSGEFRLYDSLQRQMIKENK